MRSRSFCIKRFFLGLNIRAKYVLNHVRTRKKRWWRYWSKWFAGIDRDTAQKKFDDFGTLSDAEDMFAKVLTSIMGFRLSRKTAEIVRQIAGVQTLFFPFCQFINSRWQKHITCAEDNVLHTHTLRAIAIHRRKKSNINGCCILTAWRHQRKRWKKLTGNISICSALAFSLYLPHKSIATGPCMQRAQAHTHQHAINGMWKMCFELY